MDRERTVVAKLGRLAVGVQRLVGRARSGLLDVSGLVLLSAAAWMLAAPAGVAAAGVSCLLLSWRSAGR